MGRRGGHGTPGPRMKKKRLSAGIFFQVWGSPPHTQGVPTPSWGGGGVRGAYFWGVNLASKNSAICAKKRPKMTVPNLQGPPWAELGVGPRHGGAASVPAEGRLEAVQPVGGGGRRTRAHRTTLWLLGALCSGLCGLPWEAASAGRNATAGRGAIAGGVAAAAAGQGAITGGADAGRGQSSHRF